MTVVIDLHTEHRVARVDERIFGGFLEHLGRAVYEGVYEPGNRLSDERGFRVDVLAALRRMQMPFVRYPGGNFVSAYQWRDGVGPQDERPRRPDYAWQSIESNQFGTDEFLQWCDALGARPMLAVNLGTAGAREAAELVEYCNLPAGTSVADERVRNGRRDPYGVTLWCLGNEMDGPWQAGHVSARTYAERARAASGLMKALDRTVQTIACGSSTPLMPTYLEWDRTVLEHCWDQIDHLSIHRYSASSGDTRAFLADGILVDRMLTEYRGLLDYVQGVKRSRHRVTLSFDEWNVWYRERGGEGGWQEAPHLLEEVYNVEDALVCAQHLNAFLRHADVVKLAAVAQIVNVIAPVVTRSDGLLLQTIYWPFVLLREAATGHAVHVAVRAPDLSTALGDVPVVDVAATFDEASGQGCVSIVNRDHTAPVDAAIRVADRAVTVRDATVLHGDPKRANTWDDPHAVEPAPLAASVDDDGAIRVTLPGPSHAVLRLVLTR